MYPRFLPCGDRVLMVEFGGVIDPAVNRRVNRFASAVRALKLPGVVQVIATYRSAMVDYDPLLWPSDTLDERLAPLLDVPAGEEEEGEVRLIEVPTWYAGEDLPDVAAHTRFTVDEVIRRHAGALYTVYAVGFSPGYAYMGGLPPELVTPRLATPRTRVPAGSVAIGGQQAGVYPQESPGGWRLLGRTYLRIFDPGRAEPSLFRVGDRVRFVPISAEEYRREVLSC